MTLPRKPVQQALSCRCGRAHISARGLCATCYTLQRQDELRFGGLREAVLDRDHHACRGCSRPGGRKRSIGVHHRRPGDARMRNLITLCPACHTRIHRTHLLNIRMPPMLRGLWRELHPHGPEQLLLALPARAEPRPVPQSGALWEDDAP